MFTYPVISLTVTNTQLTLLPAQTFTKRILELTTLIPLECTVNLMKTQHNHIHRIHKTSIHNIHPPHPVVSLPIANHFQGTVAMDLKIYHG